MHKFNSSKTSSLFKPPSHHLSEYGNKVIQINKWQLLEMLEVT